jgi:preprotein translocase subunit SecY
VVGLSRLEVLDPVLRFLPEVDKPRRHLAFKEKFGWTVGVLVLYFVLLQIEVYGVSAGSLDYFGALRAVLAGSHGSILALGIGPIVTASIVLQLLVGGKIIDLDMAEAEDRALFQGTQKLLTIILCFFEGVVYAFSGMYEVMPNAVWIVALQLALGGILVMFLDEVVSKWGVGSGVGLFIAAGVSTTIVQGSINFLPDPYSGGQISGAIPAFIASVLRGAPQIWRPVLPSMVSLFFTLVVFLVVVYAESLKVEIPLSYSRVGIRGKYPIRFAYASVIPLILTMALFANIRLWAGVLSSRGITLLGEVENNLVVSGPAKYFQHPGDLFTHYMDPGYLVHTAVYVLLVVACCVVFALLWVQLTNIGPREVAKQIHSSGMHIPGFRRDRRIIEEVLNRYIPTVTVLGAIFVGLLASFADLTDAIGSGTGVLLTVGIIHQMYQEIREEQGAEMFPMIRNLLGRR